VGCLERLLDLTVLGPTHQELGTCWLYMGTITPFRERHRARSDS
jgi:hypothetical protein